jgi:hypothetical protein
MAYLIFKVVIKSNTFLKDPKMKMLISAVFRGIKENFTHVSRRAVKMEQADTN